MKGKGTMTDDHNGGLPNGGRDRLESWKRIARYLGKSERTVRRWERQEQLPVHRLAHGSANSVYAFGDEIDAWIEQRSAHPVATPLRSTRTTLVLLPIEDVSPDGRHAHICRGLSEELANRFCLEAPSHIRIIARMTAGLLGQDDLPSTFLKSRLSADYFLQGALQVQDNVLKVTLHLIRLPDMAMIGSLAPSMPLDDLIGMEEAFAKQAVQTLLPDVPSPQQQT